ncbi:MAG: EutN/CcmL family microcompartment protein [Candidatus Coatesbacteria bacterium]|nr:MAG: EutN/CcmL family microcompartment protein [Candidatus Coatesbacteria bacterium]
MKIGEVVGNVWATRKVESVRSLKMLLVRVLDAELNATGELLVAADVVDAGLGDRVIVAVGRAARLAVDDDNAAVSAAVIGVVDSYELQK